ncbi:hypothetical protein [Microbispora sp. CA-102843]|uniref:hypothetical protein n=1 Tax=Microbispora sp. CA-102843 TaxID=3239952 RepID=UPI003D8AC82E
MKSSIRKGGVYYVSDRSLTMPPNDQRNLHARRPVVVLSGDAKNQQPDWDLIYVARREEAAAGGRGLWDFTGTCRCLCAWN